MSNKNKDPEVGIQDIEKYEFGGLRIDEQLANGYHLYIPYGLHCELFRAIEFSRRLMGKEIDNMEHTINNLESQMEAGNITEELFEKLKSDNLYNINKIQEQIDLFEKIYPLIHEI